MKDFENIAALMADIGARARALEQQCVTAMASLVGHCDWNEMIDVSVGRGGVFGPPDTGFPEDGILASGVLNAPGWTCAEVDLAAVAHVRADGHVLNHRHWSEQGGRDAPAPPIRLR